MPGFTKRLLQENPGQQRFTIRSGVLTGSDTSGAAQVAAVHCQNELTLDPAVCSQTDPPMPQSAALWRSMHASIHLYLPKNFNTIQCKWQKNRAGRKGQKDTGIRPWTTNNEWCDTKLEKSTLNIVCRNEDRDEKLTVGGRLFQGFITRSVKKI